MPDLFRVLVTGSRDWEDQRTVDGALLDIFLAHESEGVTVVHGHCPRGADAIADSWATAMHAHGRAVQVERHPAGWQEHGRAAGMLRNAEMVALGADVCLAFVMPCDRVQCRHLKPHGSHGASHCADLAEKAGIETRRYTA